MQGVLEVGSESLFLHLNAKTTRLQSQDSLSCCPNSPMNLVFSTTHPRMEYFLQPDFLVRGKAIQRFQDEEGSEPSFPHCLGKGSLKF